MDDAPGDTLEPFRPYLELLARMHLDHRLRARMDPADLVQDAFRKALENCQQYRGTSNDELKGWLRRILLNHVRDQVRHLTNAGHNPALEVALERSSLRLDALLAAEESSPSQKAMRSEEMLRLAEALAQLPAHQQEVVILHHLHEMKLADVAGHLGISLGKAAGLLYRGLKTLNRLMNLDDSPRLST